jgi:hypothetical protein
MSTSFCKPILKAAGTVAWDGDVRRGQGALRLAHRAAFDRDQSWRRVGLSYGGGLPSLPDRIYTSPYGKLKYMASVVGLAEDADVYGSSPVRLPSFVQAWSQAWPGLHIEHQHGFLNHPDLLGYGCAAGHYLALADSLRYLKSRNETCDYHLVFEDDAVPFDGTKWPPSGPSNDLEARLEHMDAVGGNVLVLGGHLFQDYDKARAAASAALPHGGIVHVGHIDGSYAYVFKCAAMESVVRELHAHLRHTTGPTAFERVLWGAFTSTGQPGYETGVHASVPLMVDHVHGFSATWNEVRSRPLEGVSAFWVQ